VDDEFVTAVEAEHDELQQQTRRVESEAELPIRALLVEVGDMHGTCRGLGGAIGIDPVLQCGGMNLYYADPSQA
jgi:hypothetical protein